MCETVLVHEISIRFRSNWGTFISNPFSVFNYMSWIVAVINVYQSVSYALFHYDRTMESCMQAREDSCRDKCRGGGNVVPFLNRFMFNLNGDERKTVYLIAILINRFKKKMLCYTIFFK